MKKTILLYLTVFLQISLFSQQNWLNYTKEWQKIDSLEARGMIKSALELVNKLQIRAKTDNNIPQLVKTRLYQIKYLNVTEEDAFEKMLTEMNNDAYKATFPYSAILHSYCANLFWEYYQGNRYRFYNRTYSENEGNDTRAWSLTHLLDVTIKHHLKALEEEEKLKNLPITSFKDILIQYNAPEKLRPTLYDIIAFNALDFFSTKEISITKPLDTFELNDSIYFSPASEFIKIKVQTSDSLSLQYYGIKILQNLLTYHLKKGNIDALIDVDLQRLKFVYLNTTLSNKRYYYVKALEKLLEQYKQNPYSTAIAYELCEKYKEISNEYSFLDSTTYVNKNYKRKAFELANQMLKLYPKAIYSDNLKSIIEQIQQPSLFFDAEECVIPDKPFLIKINYANIQKVYVSVQKIDIQKYKDLIITNSFEEIAKTILKNVSLNITKTITLPVDSDFNSHSVEVVLDGLHSGYYIIYISSSPNFKDENTYLCYGAIKVSNLSILTEKHDDNISTIIISERTTGKPIQRAKIAFYKYTYEHNKLYTKVKDFYTNNEGMVDVNINEIINERKDGYAFFDVEWNNEYLKSNQSFYNYYSSYEKPGTYYQIYFFTDRSIYRPGQKVYYKGIVLGITDKRVEIAPNYRVDVQFLDANYQLIAEEEKTSNEFGTFSGSFIIPEGLLNGEFTIRTNNGGTNIQVEEYKRPRFYVTAKAIDKEYFLNDSVFVKAQVKSYAGVEMKDITIKYRVVRNPRYRYWWYRPQLPATEIAQGTLITDDSGFVNISFKAIPDPQYSGDNNTLFNYTVYIDAIDINNEVQSTSCNIYAGSVGLYFDVSINDRCSNQQLEKIPFTCQNSNGKPVKATGFYRLVLLDVPKTYQNEPYWSVPDKFIYTQQEWEHIIPETRYESKKNLYKEKQEIIKTTFNTQNDTVLVIPQAKSLEHGVYRLEILSKDQKGNSIRYEKILTLYSLDEGKEIPDNSPLFIVNPKEDYEPGETARIYLGSVFDKAYVLVSIRDLNTPKAQYQWVELNNKKQTVLEIPIEEKYRGNFSVYFNTIHNNRPFTQELIINVPYKNKELKIVTETFRSKLYPNQQETWKFKIVGQKSEKITAELLASMYDKSLDQFMIHYWNFSPFYYYNRTRNFNNEFYSLISSNCNNNYRFYAVPLTLVYPQLNMFEVSYYGKYFGRYRNGKGVGSKIAFAEEAPTMDGKEKVPSPKNVLPLEDKSIDNNTSKQEDNQTLAQSKESFIRKNLNETAFFYPELKTDEQGNISFSFTTPEALTTWKFMAFAHTKDLKYGFIQKECITQKQLMITPQLPRFLREGDSLWLYIKVDNLTEKNQKVSVKINIEDVLKNSNNIVLKEQKDILVASKKSSVAAFVLKVPMQLSMVKVTVLAETESFADGEEHLLLVLPNRMLVTESFPFYVKGKQEKQIHFKRFEEAQQSKTLTNKSLTLEYTANPIWNVIQAIPYLAEYPYECNEQVFNRYYANKLSQHIVSTLPDFQNIFNNWLADTTHNTLLSPLSKNEELKSMILAETPWVRESLDEASQRKNIAKFFDKETIDKEIKHAAEKLIKSQNPNGSWGWFPGMRESQYITQYLVASIGKLEKTYNISTELHKTIPKAIKYLDNQVERDYNILKEYVKKEDLSEFHIDYLHVYYLYARSFYLNEYKNFIKSEAFQYYYQQAKQYWNQMSEYMQGLIALTTYRMGDVAIARQIIASLKERAVVSQEKGMYWKNISSGFYWYELPIETHSLLIEAFNEIDNDSKTIEELKLWLLLQKQVQNWGTTTATANAIHVLLFTGKTELNTNFDAKIQWGNQPLEINKKQIEVATGYIKQTKKNEEVTNDLATITVKNTGNDIAWGSLHWQYFENLDKITNYETRYMSIKREYYKEVITERGKKLEAINEKNVLKIGDIVVVKLIIECDRDLEFVHLKDMRPSSFEPMQVISGYSYNGGLGYYSETKDASYNFFFDYLPRGKYVLEYSLRVTQKGSFSTGISTIQCMYAPEFNAHVNGMIIRVE